MNDSERYLIRYVCEGDLKRAQRQARAILEASTAKKDEAFRETMIRQLETKRLTELPHDLRELLVAEDSENYPERKFLLRKEESKIADEALSLLQVAGELAEMGIPYLPAVMLYGESGCGKTELARYIAHKAGLPFVYVQFSNLVSSYLGSTQSNLARVFQYVRTSPCVLCFDEIDAVGMARGQKHDVGEMNRIVIALMQELDRMPNNVVIVGTTNRFDRLDQALIRRFPIRYEVKPLEQTEARELAWRFFSYAGITEAVKEDWYERFGPEPVPASSVVKICTDAAVAYIKQRRKEDFARWATGEN